MLPNPFPNRLMWYDGMGIRERYLNRLLGRVTAAGDQLHGNGFNVIEGHFGRL